MQLRQLTACKHLSLREGAALQLQLRRYENDRPTNIETDYDKHP
jgi:hypothetical protein